MVVHCSFLLLLCCIAESSGPCVAAGRRKEVVEDSAAAVLREGATRGNYRIPGYDASVATILPGKFIFLAQPHTGSSAMVLAFQDAFPEALDLRPHHMSISDVRGLPGATRMQQISRQRTRVWDHRPAKRASMSSINGSVDPDIVHKYITGKEHVFTVIRNPYDFLVSCFVRRGQGQSFESFVRSYHASPYIENGKLYYHAPNCNSVLYWEKMPLCIHRMMRKLDLPEFEIVNERFGKEFSPHYKMRHA